MPTKPALAEAFDRYYERYHKPPAPARPAANDGGSNDKPRPSTGSDSRSDSRDSSMADGEDRAQRD